MKESQICCSGLRADEVCPIFTGLGIGDKDVLEMPQEFGNTVLPV